LLEVFRTLPGEKTVSAAKEASRTYVNLTQGDPASGSGNAPPAVKPSPRQVGRSLFASAVPL
jgi:hypothetical protein